MTVKTDIYDTLQGLVSGRVFPMRAPMETARPYIVYQQIGGESPTFLERASPSKKNGRFQINAWSESAMDLEILARQIEAAMVAATVFQAKPIGDLSDADSEDVELHGTRQDFTVWSNR